MEAKLEGVTLGRKEKRGELESNERKGGCSRASSSTHTTLGLEMEGMLF